MHDTAVLLTAVDNNRPTGHTCISQDDRKAANRHRDIANAAQSKPALWRSSSWLQLWTAGPAATPLVSAGSQTLTLPFTLNALAALWMGSSAANRRDRPVPLQACTDHGSYNMPAGRLQVARHHA